MQTKMMLTVTQGTSHVTVWTHLSEKTEAVPQQSETKNGN